MIVAPDRELVKVIVAPGDALEMIERREPGPESSVFSTMVCAHAPSAGSARARRRYLRNFMIVHLLGFIWTI
jgi:hypothetical protein